MVHREFYAKLYGPSQWAVVLGAQDLNPQATQSVPPDALLSLVGEAQAFYYQRPMSRLRYRTVFDVPPGDNVVESWLGGRRQGENEWLVVSPSELERFANTYWGIPRPPPDLLGKGDPLVLPPGGRWRR